jgi:hypothetical protein
MGLQDDIKLVLTQFKEGGEQKRLKHNRKLFQIYEGDLECLILDALRSQLSEKSYEQAKHRVAPINVLKRMIEKLSKIYAKPPIRDLSGASDSDKALFSELTTAMDVNTILTLGNEFFNLFKNCAIEPFLDQGTPALRVIPSDRFIVASTDPVNPLRMTHFSKIMGIESRDGGEERVIFYTYTKDSFVIHDDLGDVRADLMVRAENPDGVNTLGRLPVIYLNRSRHELTPKIDTDTLAMTILIPLILTDINYAAMFQCFSIVYGINVSDEGLKRAPSAFWNLKQDPGSDQKPEVGVIKPEADIDKVLSLVKAQLGFWMQTRNIRPGTIGELSMENATSGIAKMVDEMDTSEDRQKQVPYFMHAEKELWDLIMYGYQPIWAKETEYRLTRHQFTPGLRVQTQFAEQKPIVDTSKIIADQVLRLTSGLQTKIRAVKMIEPDLTDEQANQLLEEILEDQADKGADEGQEIQDGKEPVIPEGDESQPQGAAGGKAGGAK